MSAIENLSQFLRQEQWTRSNIDQIPWKELDQLLDNLKEENALDEAYVFCKDVLDKAKSLVALYLTVMLGYEVQQVNYADTLQLFQILRENKKTSLIEKFASAILTYDENNIHAIRALFQIYQETKNEKDWLVVAQNLVKIDTKNGQIAEKLAEYYHQSGGDKSNQLYIHYLSVALRRYAKQKNIAKVESLWNILAHETEDIALFFNIFDIVADYQKETALHLLENSLLDQLQKKGSWENALLVIKKSLDYEEKSSIGIREKIEHIYKMIYQKHPYLDLCIESSGILNKTVPIFTAIKKFEKEIQFHAGGFVSHKTWGIGLLKSIDENSFTIDFDTKKDHVMDYTMALHALSPIAADHIWVVKKDLQFDNILQVDNIKRILLTVFKSFPNKKMTGEEIREELKDVIPAEQWNRWWTKAKNVLKTMPSIGYEKVGRIYYFLLDHEISAVEEFMRKFSRAKKLKDKISVFEQFMKEVPNIEDYTDQFQDLVDKLYFFYQQKRENTVNRLMIFLILKKLEKKHAWVLENIELDLRTLSLSKEDFITFFRSDARLEYKKDFLKNILDHSDQPLDILKEIILKLKNRDIYRSILSILHDSLEASLFKALILYMLQDSFKYYPQITIWTLSFLLEEKLWPILDWKKEDLFLEMLYRIDSLGKTYIHKIQPTNKKDSTLENEKIVRADIKKYIDYGCRVLFAEANGLPAFLKEEASNEQLEKLYHLIRTSQGLPDVYRQNMLKIILDKYPEINQTTVQVNVVQFFDAKKIWTTASALEKQQLKLQNLQREYEQNLVEMETARQKGDLRENAEYQSAREKDTHLNQLISQLYNQIQKAQILDPSNITGNKVEPGTEVTLKIGKETQTYRILGFWDTDETSNTIAYNSPLALACLGLSVGEKSTVEISGKKVDLIVLDIHKLESIN